MRDDLRPVNLLQFWSILEDDKFVSETCYEKTKIIRHSTDIPKIKQTGK